MTPTEKAELEKQVADLKLARDAAKKERDLRFEKLQLEREVANLKSETEEFQTEIDCLRKGIPYRRPDNCDEEGGDYCDPRNF